MDGFVNVTDPRIARTRWHNLRDIVMIAVCGAICECNSWEDLPRYARAKRDWFRQFLELPNGIPSADTFARVFQRLDPNEFPDCLSSIVSVLRKKVDGECHRTGCRLRAVKDNQPKLHAAIQQCFEKELKAAEAGNAPAFREHVERQTKRGRDEERRYFMMPLGDSPTFGRWRAAKTIGMVFRRRTIQGREQMEVYYYLCSIRMGVKRFARGVRGHWGIENKLHWSLDVTFAQDASRIRKGSSPEIASMVRQTALMILEQDTQLKGSLKSKRKQAGGNDALLETLLSQIDGN